MSEPEFEPFTDTKLTDAQIAKKAGITLTAYKTKVREGRGAMTSWSEDVLRWIRAEQAFTRGQRRR